MAKPKTEVAVAQEFAVGFEGERPEWAKGQGRGNENVTSNDLVLPRLEIIQSLSPIREDNPDAVEGCFFNSATMELLGDVVYLVPITYKVEYIVWTIFDEGGGFHGSYESKGEAEARFNELVSDGAEPAHLEIVDTPTHYCLMVKPDLTTQQIVVSMPKSKAKVSRRWNAAVQIGGGDRFSRIYKFATFKDKNKKNQSFYNYVVTPMGYAPKLVFEQAEKLYELFRTSAVRTDYNTVDVAGRMAESDI